MNTYKYELWVNDSWIDISAYVQTNSLINDRLDKVLDTSSFVIPHIASDEIVGLDLSLALKPWIPVMITINDTKVYRMYTANTSRDIARKQFPKLYTHNVGLIEVDKILQRKMISDFSVTQPKSAVFTGKYFADSKASNTFTVDNTVITPTLTVINESIAPTLVEGRTIKANKEAKVFVTIDVENDQFNKSWIDWLDWLGPIKHVYSSAGAHLDINIKSNGISLYTESIYITPASTKKVGNFVQEVQYALDVPSSTTISRVIEVPVDTIDQTITVEINTIGNYEYKKYAGALGIPGAVTYTLATAVTVEDNLRIPYFGVTLSSAEDTPTSYVQLDQLVDKALDSINMKDISDTTENVYKLGNATRSRIENILCPEYTLETYNAWDLMDKLANLANAVLQMGENDWTTVEFRFLDDIPDLTYNTIPFEEESTAYEMDTFVSGLEINAQNVLEEDTLQNAKIEPYEGGWMSIRTAEAYVAQVTEDNAAFKTRQAIYRPYKVFIKGVGIKITNGNSANDRILYGNVGNPLSPDSYWDISSRVVETDEWNVLQNTTQTKLDSLRRSFDTKGNTIHYTQGTNFIEGLGYKTLTVSDWGGEIEAPRALMETIMTTCAFFLDEDDSIYAGYNVVQPGSLAQDYEEAIVGAHDLFDGILARIEYIPMATVRSSIYKHNTFNSGIDVVDFINDQDKLNDTGNLGKYATTSLNELGNIQYAVSGQTEDFNDIPELGFMTYDGLVITSRAMNLNRNLVSYDLQLSRDFINQSSYVGRKSAFRQFEVPKKEVVFRQDKYREFMVLTKNPTIVVKDFTILSQNALKKIVQNFSGLVDSNTYPISYAKATVTKENGGLLADNVESFDLPVNGYSLGTTINLQMEFDTNYSAGPTKYPARFNAENVVVQSYKTYNSRFGNVYSIALDLSTRGQVDNDASDADAYPEFDNAPTDSSIINLEMIINKDAREKYGTNIELPFIPEDSDVIRTFPGISKYNGLIRNKDKMEVEMALLQPGYWPSVNQTKVISGKTKITNKVATAVWDTTNNVYNLAYNLIPIESGASYDGYVVYEKTTGALIYAVKEAISGTTLYSTDAVSFVPRKYLKDTTIPTE